MANKDPLYVDVHALKKAALVFRALNNGLRREILQLLHEKGSLRVSEIYRQMKLSQSTTSQQLGILRRSGVVKAEKHGKQVFYSINYNRLTIIQQLAGELLQLKKL